MFMGAPIVYSKPLATQDLMSLLGYLRMTLAHVSRRVTVRLNTG